MHTTTTAGIDEREWQRQGDPKRRAIHGVLAATFVTLAGRLDPAGVLTHCEALPATVTNAA